MANPTTKHAVQLALVAVLAIALDQLSKWVLLYEVGMINGPPIEVTSFFRLVMVWNQGVSFGMLNHGTEYMPWFLVAVAVVISVIMLRLGLKSAILLERIGYGLVIGGALGNVVDRFRFRAVADFFSFHVGSFAWPAFNVADSFICIGVVILLWMMMRHPSQP
jgi:signal peptidase II